LSGPFKPAKNGRKATNKMGKIVNNPDFTDDTSLDTSTKVDETKDEEVEEKGETTETSEGDEKEEKDADSDKEKESSETSSEDKKALAAKQRELEGLNREEEQLGSQLSDIEKQIAEKRQAIVSKRAVRREKREDLKKDSFQSDEQEDDILKDVDPKEVDRLNKVIKALGYVPKAEIEQQRFVETQSEAEKEFFTSHPEYKPENDPNDELYGTLREEFSMFARPKTPSQVKSLLERAHREVAHKFPSKFVPKKDSSSSQNIKSNRARMAVAGAGQSASGASSKNLHSKEKKFSPDMRHNMHGYSEEELDEMGF